jgi:hypothetical protein
MQEQTKPLSLVPDTRDLIATSHRTEGGFPNTQHIVVFEYPKCFREFDGKHWTLRMKEGV